MMCWLASRLLKVDLACATVWGSIGAVCWLCPARECVRREVASWAFDPEKSCFSSCSSEKAPGGRVAWCRDRREGSRLLERSVAMSACLKLLRLSRDFRLSRELEATLAAAVTICRPSDTHG